MSLIHNGAVGLPSSFNYFDNRIDENGLLQLTVPRRRLIKRRLRRMNRLNNF
jgi:hypothetical protein